MLRLTNTKRRKIEHARNDLRTTSLRNSASREYFLAFFLPTNAMFGRKLFIDLYMKRHTLPRKIIRGFHKLAMLPHLILFSTARTQAVIVKDLVRWVEIVGDKTRPRISQWDDLVWLLRFYPEFRNLFYYRLVEGHTTLAGRVCIKIARRLYRPLATLYIYTPVIGAGLFIQHGFSTIITAKSIGKNCWVNQQVTIGYVEGSERPIIGDNVKITAGAKVLGSVTLGDNVVVGANAVVVKNVPSDCTVVGVPAYIIKREGRKVREAL